VYQSIVKAYSRIGRWQNDSHDVAGAVQSMEAAVRTAEQWVASSPQDAAALAELASGRQHLSNALRLRGDLAGAAEQARLMEEIALRQYRADPASVSRRSLLVRAYQSGLSGSVSPVDMVMALVNPGKIATMIALAEELAAKEPDNTGLTDLLGRAYVARCLVDEPRLGVPACRKAVQLYDRLHAADPGNYYFLATRSIGRMALATVLRRTGDRAESLSLAMSTVAELRRRRREDSTMLLCLLVAGEVEIESGEPEPARRDFEEAHRLARLGYDADAKDARYAAFLAQSLEGLGAFARQTRDWSAAAVWYQKAVDVWKEWPSRGVTGKYDQEHLREAARQMEECRTRAGDSQ
jgi:tetratricopeptide (TPR) repeat protein